MKQIPVWRGALGIAFALLCSTALRSSPSAEYSVIDLGPLNPRGDQLERRRRWLL